MISYYFHDCFSVPPGLCVHLCVSGAMKHKQLTNMGGMMNFLQQLVLKSCR